MFIHLVLTIILVLILFITMVSNLGEISRHNKVMEEMKQEQTELSRKIVERLYTKDQP